MTDAGIITALGRIERILEYAFPGSRVRSGLQVNSVDPSPPPTPNLDILRRFAKVAGWLPGPEKCVRVVRVGLPDHFIEHESSAAAWLDSPEALDAAAIVAARKAGGLAVMAGYASLKTALVIPVGCSPCERFDEMRGLVRVDLAVSRSRAAVLACLAAFEEKPE